MAIYLAHFTLDLIPLTPQKHKYIISSLYSDQSRVFLSTSHQPWEDILDSQKSFWDVQSECHR